MAIWCISAETVHFSMELCSEGMRGGSGMVKVNCAFCVGNALDYCCIFLKSLIAVGFPLISGSLYSSITNRDVGVWEAGGLFEYVICMYMIHFLFLTPTVEKRLL